MISKMSPELHAKGSRWAMYTIAERASQWFFLTSSLDELNIPSLEQSERLDINQRMTD